MTTTQLRPDNASPESAGSEVTYSVGFRTDKGMTRSGNEDSAAVLDIPGYSAAFIVADGMGGLRAGDIASGEAVRIVQETLRYRFSENPNADTMQCLAEAFRLANDAVNGLAKPDASEGTTLQGRDATQTAAGGLMGTTLVVGLVKSGILYVGHVGDSRAYMLRDGSLHRLTEDHSFVADRVRAGDMTEAEARVSRFRNMITRAIGIEAEVRPDFRSVELQAGDIVLACSDGLTTMMEDDEIESILRTKQTARLSPERAASSLVDVANRKGGYDNVTVVLLRVYGAGEEEALAALPPPESAAPAKPGRGAKNKNGAVIDIDTAPDLAGRRRRTGNKSGDAASPLLTILAVLGVLALVFVAATVVSPDVRALVASTVSGARGYPGAALPGMQASPEFSVPSAPDYASLTYGVPHDFGSLLVRGDLLAYSANGGLYAVADSTGKLVSLSPHGVPQRQVDMLPPAPVVSAPVADSHLFLATDPQGNVYESLTSKKIVEKRAPNGRLLATLRGFSRPEAIAVDTEGNLYVVDMNTIKQLRAYPKSLPGEHS